MKEILVVDDEADVEFIFSVMLEEEILDHKLKIDFFTNPYECLQYVKNHPKKYDYIFTDINMPQINGIQFVSELRKSGYESPVAFISAYLMEDYERDMEKLNISTFLSKPLNFGQVRNLLNL